MERSQSLGADDIQSLDPLAGTRTTAAVSRCYPEREMMHVGERSVRRDECFPRWVCYS
jgi:hypothetical protein